MRYIFVFLILANVILLAFVFYDKGNEHTTEIATTQTSPLKQKEVDEKQAKQQHWINETTPDAPLTDTKTPEADSPSLTSNGPVNDSNQLSIAPVKLAKPESVNVAVQSNTVWQCLEVTSDAKLALEEFDTQYQLGANIVVHKSNELRSTMVYIGAATPQQANQLRARVIQLNLVKDPYVSRYKDQLIVSVGVFRSENSIKNIKSMFAAYPEFNLQLRPLYSEKITYKMTLILPKQSAESLSDEAAKRDFVVQQLKSEKDCN